REESGPSTRMRLGPNSAYARSGTIVAYRPKIPGTPEATAYAIPTGTSIVVSTRPAVGSCGSQAASDRLGYGGRGGQRFQPFMPCPLNRAHSQAAICGGAFSRPPEQE